LRNFSYFILAAVLTGCATQHSQGDHDKASAAPAAAEAPLAAQAFYPSTYKVLASPPTLI
jgi:hypothetical protein